MMKRKSRPGGASASLLITFLLGMGVGFGLCYALFDFLQEDRQPTPTLLLPSAAPADIRPSGQDTAESAAAVAGPEAADIGEYPATIDPMDSALAWPARHLILGIPGPIADEATMTLLRTYQPYGIWLQPHNCVSPDQVANLLRTVQEAAAPENRPFLVFAAQEGGPEGNPLRFDHMPDNATIANLETLEAIQGEARRVAGAAVALGVHVFLSPTLDIFEEGVTPPEWRTKYFGATPDKVTNLGLAYAEGLRAAGILAVARHYPGMGAALRREGALPILNKSINDLAAQLLPFAEAAAYDMPGILVGALLVPALEPEHPERPASLSPVLVREILRKDWGYAGVILADDILKVSPWSENTPAQNVTAALAAGCDAVLISEPTPELLEETLRAVREAAQSGALNVSDLEVSRHRLDAWRQQLAKLRQESPPPPAQDDAGITETPQDPSMPAVETAPPLPDADVVPPDQEPDDAPEDAVADPPPAPAPPSIPGAPPTPEEPADETPVSIPEGSRQITHMIAPGETLTGIARRYGVTTRQIMQWNQLADTTIKFGRTLTIHTNEPSATEEPAPETPTEPSPVVNESETPSAINADSGDAAPVPVAPIETPDGTPESPETPVSPAAGQAPEPASENISGAETPSPTPQADAETPPETAPASEAAQPEQPSEPVAEVPDVSAAPAGTTRREYTCETDMTLAQVAEIFGVSAAELKQWNRLEQDTVTAGTVLVVFLPMAEEAAPAGGNAGDVSTSQQPAGVPPPGNHVPYVIQTGDTLHGIARRFNTTAAELIRINQIADPDWIVLGSTIQVPATE